MRPLCDEKFPKVPRAGRWEFSAISPRWREHTREGELPKFQRSRLRLFFCNLNCFCSVSHSCTSLGAVPTLLPLGCVRQTSVKKSSWKLVLFLFLHLSHSLTRTQAGCLWNSKPCNSPQVEIFPLFIPSRFSHHSAPLAHFSGWFLDVVQDTTHTLIAAEPHSNPVRYIWLYHQLDGWRNLGSLSLNMVCWDLSTRLLDSNAMLPFYVS